MTRTLLFVFAFLLLAASATGQARTFELVGGDVLFTTLRGHEKGQYLPVRPVGTADTLWVWIQGVSKARGPSRAQARTADLVAWCFPKQYPDRRHVLSEAARITVVTERHSGKRWISFVAEGTMGRVLNGAQKDPP